MNLVYPSFPTIFSIIIAMQTHLLKLLCLLFSSCEVIDIKTRTRRTDRPSYGDAMTHLKSHLCKYSFSIQVISN